MHIVGIAQRLVIKPDLVVQVCDGDLILIRFFQIRQPVPLLNRVIADRSKLPEHPLVSNNAKRFGLGQGFNLVGLNGLRAGLDLAHCGSAPADEHAYRGNHSPLIRTFFKSLTHALSKLVKHLVGALARPTRPHRRHQLGNFLDRFSEPFQRARFGHLGNNALGSRTRLPSGKRPTHGKLFQKGLTGGVKDRRLPPAFRVFDGRYEPALSIDPRLRQLPFGGAGDHRPGGGHAGGRAAHVGRTD